MPTGYTSKLNEKEQTLVEFLSGCYSAFVYDSNPDTIKIAVPEENNSMIEMYTESIESEKAKLNELKSLSVDELEARAQRDYEEELEANRKRIREKLEIKSRYENMLEKIRAWNPPTKIQNLKDFAIQQLESSIKYDCSTKYMTGPDRLSGQEWYARKLESCNYYIAYYEERIREAIEENIKKIEFVKTLLDELERLKDV